MIQRFEKIQAIKDELKKITQGQWEVFAWNKLEDGENAANLHIRNIEGSLIARVYKRGRGLALCETEAKFIASAPDYIRYLLLELELCQELRQISAKNKPKISINATWILNAATEAIKLGCDRILIHSDNYHILKDTPEINSITGAKMWVEEKNEV